jgi:hypothetical protein
VKIFYKDAFEKHAKLFEELGVNVNNGMVNLFDKLETLPSAQRDEVMRDLHACHEHRPELAMVDSAKGITSFAAGVPLIDALESTAGATNNVVYEEAVMKIREDVATGQQLQFAMRATNKFPSMAVQMVAIGEESGALDAMLDKVATHYENEVDNAVDGLTAMMEPLIMAVLGVLVGGLVIAMYLPIFQMGSVV